MISTALLNSTRLAPDGYTTPRVALPQMDKPIRIRRIHMGTKNVRLDEDVDERVRSRKHPDETFSEAIDRLTGEPSLLDLAGLLTTEEAAEIRESLRDTDDNSREGLDRLSERLDS